MTDYEYVQWRPIHGIVSVIALAVFISALAAISSYRAHERNRHECIPKILIDEEPYPIPPSKKIKPLVKKFT